MDEVEPFSIYLDLKQGAKADLETVARAALELAAALRQAAFIVDPSLDFRMELASGTESSLSLNSLFKGREQHRKTLKGLAIGAAVWLGSEVGRDIYEISPLHALVTGHAGVTDAEIDRIADAVAKTIITEPVRSHVQSFYRELERDPAIDGVGATRVPGKRPETIVPRSEFPKRAGVDEVIETTSHERERTAIETVILVSPVLLESSRKWRFKSGSGEFGATIDDDKFLSDVLSGRRVIPMVEGLLMEVELKTVEEKTPEGLWKPIDRRILRVISLKGPETQRSMDLIPPRPPKDDRNQGN